MFFEKKRKFQVHYAEAGGAVAEKPTEEKEKSSKTDLKRVSDFDLRQMMKDGDQDAFDEQDRRDFEIAASKKSKKEKAGALYVLHDELSDWLVKESSFGIVLNGLKKRTNTMRNTLKLLKSPYNILKSVFPTMLK